jgi:formylglycine-generating enzyme required for sulfatase activity
VWEWCLNEYSETKQTSIQDDQSRALCGGSWRLDADLARAAVRFHFLPDYSNIDLGFRGV